MSGGLLKHRHVCRDDQAVASSLVRRELRWGTDVLGLLQRRPRRVPLEEQLQVLDSCGIRLKPGSTADELILSCSRDEYEATPFLLLAEIMGSEVEAEPYGRLFSDNLWNIDLECIEDHGAYTGLINDMIRISAGTLPIEHARDHVDIDAGEVWVELRLDGQTHRFEPEICDDWADPEFFEFIASLHKARQTERRFACLNPGDQFIIIACPTPTEYKNLRRKAGLDFEWIG